MSNRFDHTLERKLESRPDGADDGVVDVRRIELITGTGRRRQWSTGDKARILLESLEPGANVSEVARRNGLSPQQLFGWRREARALIGENAIEAANTRPADLATPARAPARRHKRGRAKPPGNERPPNAPATHFAPIVLVASGAVPPASPLPPDRTRGIIEIVIGDALVRVVGKVDRGALAEVLAALRRSS